MNKFLVQLEEILIDFVKEIAEKDRKATSDAELNAMIEAANTIVHITVVKSNLL